MEVAQQDNFAAMRQKRIDQMAKMRHQISSPKLREMLKEKCRIRMKESRHNLHDGRRLMGNEERRTFMSQILKEEIVELETDIEKQELIYQEIMEEADQWLYEEMESAEETLINNLLDVESVFCPICQKSSLMYSEGTITCDCGIKFAFKQGLEKLHGNIQFLVAKHEKNCNTRLHFFVEPSQEMEVGASGFSSLNAYCATCEFFSVLIS